MEPFTFIETSVGSSNSQYRLFDDVVELTSAKNIEHDIQYVASLRKAFPELIVTACPANSAPLRAFAAAGFATCDLDTKTDSFASWRGYVAPSRRADNGLLGEAVTFAKYHYKWNNMDFIMYLVDNVQYILIEQRGDEGILGPSAATDDLIRAAGDWSNTIADVVWVYDMYWTQSNDLWKEVQKASWDKVILDPHMKDDLQSVSNKFFDSEETYRELGVPWKRGLLFHGPPGNGKTISIKALMHSLYNREKSIPTLYVRYAPYTWCIDEIFSLARAQAPCMLILEDVETIVTSETRSYFFNEMDGLENNDGLFIVASTNFLDKLDPGLSKRPSRFDRKYLFPIPNEHERALYCEYWRQKVKPNKNIIFPKKLCAPMAHITPGFSFAFLQECFVGTMLALANTDGDREREARPFDSDNDDLDDYKIWGVFNTQANILRKEIDDQSLSHVRSARQHPTNTQLPIRSMASPRSSKGNLPMQERFEPSGVAAQSRSRIPSLRRVNTAGSTAVSCTKSELLPDLPYFSKKYEYFTPGAFEKRL